MSESLKNFVTVRELLDGDDAVDPEAFRIFCGLHRYASTVSYSRVKLAEADAARRDFDIFRPSMCKCPVCNQHEHHVPVKSALQPRHWAISFSWWGKARSTPPAWRSRC